MRTLVIGDIHGGLKALEQVLERAEIAPSDTLIFLGDYVDGWSQSPQVIDYLIELNTKNRCVFIRGNHDDLCYEWLTKKKNNPMWLQHGGKATVEAYNKVKATTIKRHIRFIEDLKNYHIDNENRLYVHAGFTNLKGPKFEYFPEMMYWDRTLWETALSMNKDLDPSNINYPERLKLFKEIYIGHTPTTRIGLDVPYNAANVWNIDSGAAYKSPLSLIDTETKQIWQSDPVHTLYPHENGRN
ncbi:metallophosphoesterase family protein [Sungkyunkwania multivorans]|uniref:Metallophosphoesterase family protein n=1 Tax=Sungkyunkwania multivorans TaxID=1173618 RepID=A0ABW3D374_9FLAO